MMYDASLSKAMSAIWCETPLLPKVLDTCLIARMDETKCLPYKNYRYI